MTTPPIPPAKPLVQDLAEVLSRTVVGWEHDLGFDLVQHPEVVRVMARYRSEHLGQVDTEGADRG